MTRAERYALSLKAREEGQEQAGGSFPSETHPEYCTADKGTPMLFRPMSFGSELLPKTGTDHRFFYYSFMKDDNNKFFPFKWGFEAWYKHPIYELVKTVAKYKYDETKPKGQQKTYDNEGCELLLDIVKNGDASNTLSNGWQPTKTLLMNVLDRMDTWCKDNKHSKVLTYRADHDEESDRWKTDYGVKSSQYDEMTKLAEEEMGSICDFDFLTLKYKTAKEVGQGKKEYYKTLLAEAKKPYIEEHYGEEFVNAIFEDYDEEEMSYEQYDFDSMPLYRASTMGYFLSKKASFVQAVDKKYGTDFFTKFTAIANEEKKARGEEVEETTTTESKEVEKEITTEESKTTTSRRSVKVEETTTEFNPRDLDKSIYKGIEKMSDEELSKIVGVDDEGLLIFAEGVTLEACEKKDCLKSFDLNSQVCPYCSSEYL